MAKEFGEKLEKLVEKEGESEKKIPVFTVIRNSSILKNIFLIDTPPDPQMPTSSTSTSTTGMMPKKEEEEKELLEEILVIGRHPDCNITLEHPSISRFHLRIHSIPSLQSLSVIDLSSVHGTWVSGKKIEAGVRVELNEGDSLGLGLGFQKFVLKSLLTKLLTVHGTWVSGKKIEAGVRVELNEGDSLQLGGSTRVYRLHWVPLSRAYDMKNPFVPPLDESEPGEQSAEQTHVHQDADSSCPEDDRTDTTGDYFEGLDLLFADMNVVSSMEQLSPSAALMPEEDVRSTFSFEEDAKDEILPGKMLPQREIAEMQAVWQLDKEDSRVHVSFTSAVSQTSSQAEDPDSLLVRSQERSGMSIWERRGKSASVNIQTGRDRENCKKAATDLGTESESNENIGSRPISEDLFAAADWVEEVSTPDKENWTPDTLLNRPLKEIAQDKNKYEVSANSLLSSMDEEVEEAFTPDKENITPKTHLLRSIKKLGKLEEINHLKTYRSSPLKNAGSINNEEVDMFMLSDHQIQLSKLLQERKSANPASRSLARSEAAILKVREVRVPFQSLLVSSTKKKSEALHQEGRISSSESVKNPQMKEISSKEDDRTWTMVVDRACLLDQGARKALQLMQGLHGTSLIIPRIVLRELDSMKRHNSLFSRTTGVDSALQWIEECMVKSKWWIHVQNSVEDVRPIAPTPRAISLSESNEEKEKSSIGSVLYSPFGSLLDIISPTIEDHVLECALFFRRIRNNGQLVLLSNDVTLKIKAMAEGLRCETAEEFRESLVNPFSERFLWTASSPRGPTWSCLDDVVLREKYYHGPSRKQSKLGEAAKGLKLILLHNSQYRQISSVT